jgi:predicted kinase
MKTLYITIGCPASGKSTYVKKYVEDNQQTGMYLSSDELRAKFGSGETDQTVTPQVFSHIKLKITEFLTNVVGDYLIIDATSINRKNRRDYIDLTKNNDARIVAWVFERPRNVLVERNKNRDRVVPEWVIDKMLNQYERPTTDEGFDEIIEII